MEIEGYQYITHKIIKRPWGIECRFTVARQDGSHINDIVMIEDENLDENRLAERILQRLALIDVSVMPNKETRLYSEDEVKALLVSKGYLKEEQSIEDLKPLSELKESK